MAATFPTLETPRLILRAFADADAPVVQHLAGDFKIADTTLLIPHPYPDGAAESWIASHPTELASGRGVTLAITLRESGAVIGAIGFHAMVAGHQAELGYWVGVPFWGKGYCTEASRALIAYAFTELDLVRVHACHVTRNPASGRVMQKLGMKHEGTRRKHTMRWGVLEDLELYGVLKEEWR